MKDNKVIILIVFIIGIIILSTPRIKKEENKEIIDKENIIAIKLKDGGNYTDTDSVPTSGYTLNTTESICKDLSGNKIDRIFEYENGVVKIPVTKKGTKCTLVFDKEIPNAAETLIAKGEMVNENGYRYEGKTPNNYVTFNNETWRIIGVFDVTNADTNETESLVKLIRNESIGNIAWDIDCINDWSKSSMYSLLNKGDYYNRTNTYSTNGLTPDSKSMIQSVVWNLGGAGPELTALEMYTAERGTIGSGTNPTLVAWPGEVGLIYASDYGYAADSVNCERTTLLRNYGNISSCKSANWLFNTNTQWTITPVYPHAGSINIVGNGSMYGGETYSYSGNDYSTFPSVYLKSNVKILDNGKDGSSSKPYDLSLS